MRVQGRCNWQLTFHRCVFIKKERRTEHNMAHKPMQMMTKQIGVHTQTKGNSTKWCSTLLPIKPPVTGLKRSCSRWFAVAGSYFVPLMWWWLTFSCGPIFEGTAGITALRLVCEWIRIGCRNLHIQHVAWEQVEDKLKNKNEYSMTEVNIVQQSTQTHGWSCAKYGCSSKHTPSITTTLSKPTEQADKLHPLCFRLENLVEKVF